MVLIAAPSLAMSQASNFTSYTGDLKNTTAILQWPTTYCHFDNTTHKQVANDLDAKHTKESQKTYDVANNILSNNINKELK
jgi:hypothetical protein